MDVCVFLPLKDRAGIHLLVGSLCYFGCRQEKEKRYYFECVHRLSTIFHFHREHILLFFTHLSAAAMDLCLFTLGKDKACLIFSGNRTLGPMPLKARLDLVLLLKDPPASTAPVFLASADMHDTGDQKQSVSSYSSSLPTLNFPGWFMAKIRNGGGNEIMRESSFLGYSSLTRSQKSPTLFKHSPFYTFQGRTKFQLFKVLCSSYTDFFCACCFLHFL